MDGLDTLWSREVRYGGRPAGLAGPAVGGLTGAVAIYDTDHPVRRFVAQMVDSAIAVEAGAIDDSYSDRQAKLYARSVLMPDALFIKHQLHPDDVLASAFNVPLEQAAHKRDDLIRWR